VISVLPGVLTPTHLRLLEIVGRAANQYEAPNLRLEGGTALAAYYLGHLESEDLDFFGDPGLNARHFLDAVIPLVRETSQPIPRFICNRAKTQPRGYPLPRTGTYARGNSTPFATVSLNGIL